MRKFCQKSEDVDAILWAIIGYAAAAFVELSAVHEDIHLEAGKLIQLGLLATGVLLATLMGLVILILRGSSKSHRLFVQSFLILALTLPMAGIQLVSDLNRELDTMPPEIIITKVIGKREVLHRGRRGRKYTTYHLTLAPAVQDHVSVPDDISVQSGLYRQLRDGANLKMTISPGYFKIPWFRSMEPAFN